MNIFDQYCERVNVPNTDFALVEPKAGEYVSIMNRMKLIPEEDKMLHASAWYTLHLLPSLFSITHDKFVINILFESFLEKIDKESTLSVTDGYTILSQLSDELFFEFLMFCIAAMPKNKLKEWYDFYSDNFYSSKKKEDELKKD